MSTATIMRAVTFSRYAGPEQMSMTEIPVPEPGAGQVRLRIEAAALNPYDWHIYRGDPGFARLSFGLFGPGERVLGSDAAGVVDAVGEGVTAFAVGDAVFGRLGAGACGEFALGDVRALARRPASVDAITAAALPMAGVTAIDGLRAAGVGPGSNVLIIGAAGGVGHLAVQIALALGAARVVAVCSGANASFVEGLGAARVIDYRTERVEDCGERFDAVIDMVSTTPVGRLRRVMTPAATYSVIGGLAKGGLLGPVAALVRGRFAAMLHRVRWTVRQPGTTVADLEQLASWVASGHVTPAIAGVYSLDEVKEALHRLEGQHVAGKLVIKVA